MSSALPEARIPLAHPSAPAAADVARNPRRLMLAELLFMSCLTWLSPSSIGRTDIARPDSDAHGRRHDIDLRPECLVSRWKRGGSRAEDRGERGDLCVRSSALSARFPRQRVACLTRSDVYTCHHCRKEISLCAAPSRGCWPQAG